MSIEPTQFRQALGYFASGITVITTQHENQLHGTTVSSFCSLSLDPPLILVGIDRQANIHDLITASGIFGVNILSEHAKHISQHFARRLPDKFTNINHKSGHLTVPLLDDALVTLECRLYAQYPGGDHSIFVGEVIHLNIQSQAQPLLYYRSNYALLEQEQANQQLLPLATQKL